MLMPRLKHFPTPLLLLSLLVASLVACEAGPGEPPPLPSHTQQAAGVLPSNTHFVGMVDLQHFEQNAGISFSSERGITIRFLDSDITFNPLSPADQETLNDVIATTGFDPGKDIRAIYVTSARDTVEGQAQSRSPSFVLQGTFQPDRLREYLAERTGPSLRDTTYRGISIYRYRGDDADSAVISFALLDQHLAIAGSDESSVCSMIDRHQGTHPSLRDQPASMRLIAQVASGSGLWMAARNLPTQQLAQEAEFENADLQRLSRVVRDVAAAVTFADHDVQGRILLTTDRNAADLASVVRGLIAAMRSNNDLSDEQLAMLDDIEVVEGDGEVTVRFTVDQKTFARMALEMMRASA